MRGLNVLLAAIAGVRAAAINLPVPRAFALLLCVSCTLLSGPASVAARERGPWPCYWVYGRLRPYNGTPTFRIWPRNTTRLLGVVSATGREDQVERLPASVRRFNPRFGRDFWGRFRVCPATPEHQGWMRMVILTDAKDLTVVDN